MAICLDHTIVTARDKQESARFFTELFGLADAVAVGRFLAVELNNGVTLDFLDVPDDDVIVPQHYAFAVSDNDFDAIYAAMTRRNIVHWADPHATKPGEINHHNGGRGVYFFDPAGHVLEILTTK